VDYAADQLHRLAHFPHSGDLLALGAIEDDGRVVTFEKQIATHGGLGGSQVEPFIAWPSECPLDPQSLNDANDLYRYFSNRYLRQPVADGLSGRVQSSVSAVAR
jgi:hypothetical protein